VPGWPWSGLARGVGRRLRRAGAEGHDAPAAAISPDGTLLAAGSSDGSVWLWYIANPARPSLIATLTGPAGHVYSVAFNPSGMQQAPPATTAPCDLGHQPGGSDHCYMHYYAPSSISGSEPHLLAPDPFLCSQPTAIWISHPSGIAHGAPTVTSP
jgi:WD40 domain-containing protein